MNETSGAHPDKRPNKTKPTGHRRESSQNLRMAAEELIKAADLIDALPAKMLPHEKERLEMDGVAWVEFAERLIGETKRRMEWA